MGVAWGGYGETGPQLTALPCRAQPRGGPDLTFTNSCCPLVVYATDLSQGTESLEPKKFFLSFQRPLNTTWKQKLNNTYREEPNFFKKRGVGLNTFCVFPRNALWL